MNFSPPCTTRWPTFLMSLISVGSSLRTVFKAFSCVPEILSMCFEKISLRFLSKRAARSEEDPAFIMSMVIFWRESISILAGLFGLSRY